MLTINISIYAQRNNFLVENYSLVQFNCSHNSAAERLIISFSVAVLLFMRQIRILITFVTKRVKRALLITAFVNNILPSPNHTIRISPEKYNAIFNSKLLLAVQTTRSAKLMELFFANKQINNTVFLIERKD